MLRNGELCGGGGGQGQGRMRGGGGVKLWGGGGELWNSTIFIFRFYNHCSI